jgi:uncharacterized flavoprotein (TIGR03862 family)
MSCSIIGAGPAGLIAAETLAKAGVPVAIFDHMARPARKFLLAGRGGLNLTHSEPLDLFLTRYGKAADALAPAIRGFPPDALRAWCEGLGEPTFVGSSGRVFPRTFKAAPLLRAWLRRLDALGVVFRPKHRWCGWGEDGSLRFEHPGGTAHVGASATVLALGGASWPRMGSDGAWADILHAAGVGVRPLLPSNCGVEIAWSAILKQKFEGVPLKRIALHFAGHRTTGDIVLTSSGLEGGPIYALSRPIRDALAAGPAMLDIDLRPDLDDATLSARLATPARGRSLGNFLRQELALSPAAIGLIQEARHGAGRTTPLASLLRAVPVEITGLSPIERAISSAGGVAFSDIDENFMLRSKPGVFLAGEMLDWEAPTGGYLLQACFSTGVGAAKGVIRKEGRIF